MAHDDECGCDRCAKWEALHDGKTEPVQYTLSDDAWRKLYAGLAMEGLLVHYGSEGHEQLARHSFHIADAMVAKAKRMDVAEPALPLGAFPERRGGLEPTDGETQ